MKKYVLLLLAISFITITGFSQEEKPKKESVFWKKVQFGGGLTLNMWNNITNIGISPSAIYHVDDSFSVGTGFSYLYSKQKNNPNSLNAYGGSIITLYNPIKQFQLSSEYEYTYITNGTNSRNVPALFLGIGYTSGRNIAAGVRYDVLYDENKSLYANALMPFVRVYF